MCALDLDDDEDGEPIGEVDLLSKTLTFKGILQLPLVFFTADVSNESSADNTVGKRRAVVVVVVVAGCTDTVVVDCLNQADSCVDIVELSLSSS